MDIYICNKCGFKTEEKPNKNETCKSCGRGRYKLYRICECGKMFHPGRSKQIFCSQECGYKFRNSSAKKGRHYPHLQRARVGICPVCGKEFRAVKDFTSRKQIYCSDECRKKRSRVINYCAQCGKEIVTFTSQNKKFCGLKCRNAYYAEHYNGENSPSWRGGKTTEAERIKGSKRYREWRTMVFKRDNYTCQECGKRGRVEAHHIKPKSKFPELMFDVNNGITLCHECHAKTDSYGSKARSSHGTTT